MKLSLGKNKILFIASFVFVIHSSQAEAVCSRDDVTFYLDKGFTTDQIAGMKQRELFKMTRCFVCSGE